MRNLVSFLTILALSWPCKGATSSNGGRSEIIGDESEIDFVRRRAQAIPACNEVIELLTVSQISQMLTDITEREGPNALRALLATFSQSELQYDVQVYRICASCNDVTSTSTVFEEFCGPDDFGSDVPFSGLLMIPLDASGARPVGTLKGMLHMHGTSTNEVPSIQWNGVDTDSTIQIQLGVASAGSAVILPDYMGYAESSETTFKSYMVRESYETSVIPLWLFTQQLLRDETDCMTALGDAVYILGYDEGGYSSVVAANALHRMGVTVIAVFSGGAPYQMGSQALLRIVQGIDEGTFPSNRRELLALLGSAYSSTYPDLANYQQGQDLLSDLALTSLIESLQNGDSEDTIRMAISETDPLSIYNADFVSFARRAINEQNFDPCSSDTLDAEPVNFLCEALKDNDLTEILMNAIYPITICHSPADELISFDNVPDVSQNSFLSYVPATGSHDEAEEYCILTGAVFSFSGVFQTYIPPPAHFVDGCPSPTDAPSRIPSMVPSTIPSTAPSGGRSEMPSDEPSMIPSLVPTSSPVQTCGARNAPCVTGTDCCSGRCTINVCRTGFGTAKMSLFEGFGGAGGGPSRVIQNDDNASRRIRGLRFR